MSAQPPFKFRMLHGLVLVAGVASSLSLRWTMSVCASEIQSAIREWGQTQSILLVLSRVPKFVNETAPLMAMMTLTLLAMTLCPPRPRLPALTRRAGFVALFAASFTILAVVALDVFDRWASPWVFGTIYVQPWKVRPFELDYIFNVGKPLSGYAVAAAWGLMWLGRRWRRAPTCLDVMGRGVGVYWIGISLLAKFYPYLY